MNTPGASPRRLFVITRRCGRLANRLFLFAQFIAYAEEHGHRVMNFTFHSYADLFEHLRDDVLCRYPVAPKTWLDRTPGLAPLIRRTRLFFHGARLAAAVNATVRTSRKVLTLVEPPEKTTLYLDDPETEMRLGDARIVLAHGWRFRAPHSVRRHAEVIRSFFKPAPDYERISRQAVSDLRQDADVVVGVHVRQGDYREWKGGRFFYPVARYAEWMRELAAQFPGQRVAFLVCSDERRSAEEFPGLKVGFGTNSSMGDLYALAGCNYLFGPQSTFSQWASFYGNTPIFQLRDREARLERDKFQVLDLVDL
jgi:hypothetical protein